MATVAIMIGGAILNATTFVGGSYLAKYLSGDSSDAERVRHDKALEKYQADYEKYQEEREKIADWTSKRRDDESVAAYDLNQVDRALKEYDESHREPVFSDYYRPSSGQKMGELVYVGGGMLVLVYVASRMI